MIRATRETLLVAAELSSVPTALAASSARRLKAACAPIASDTVPIMAAAIARVRRENGSRVTFITVNPDRCQRRACLVAPQLPGVYEVEGNGQVWCRSIAINL